MASAGPASMNGANRIHPTSDRTVRLSLPLFMTRFFADDAHGAVAPDYLAVSADSLNRSAYFHFSTPDNLKLNSDSAQ
jgi:hypothetical protein